MEVTTDGGNTWNVAAGTTNWNYPWTPPANGTYTIEWRATDDAGNVETEGQGIAVTIARRTPKPVLVSGKQISVGGKTFIMRGVGYSPVPIGDDPEIVTPFGDYFTSQYHAIYDRDLPIIRQIGANAIRLWSWDNTANHLDFLDKAYNGGGRLDLHHTRIVDKPRLGYRPEFTQKRPGKTQSGFQDDGCRP